MNQAQRHKLLWQRLQKNSQIGSKQESAQQRAFEMRLAANLPMIDWLFFQLFSEEKHTAVFEGLLNLLFDLFKARPVELKQMDLQRQQNPEWFLNARLAGMQLYVDRFNGTIKGVHKKLPYFEELGINLLHLMPIMKRPKKENDGGYAVSHYTQVDSQFGSTNDLWRLSREMRKRKMILMLDFVVNHTSDEHDWAKNAKKGSIKHQNYYHCFKHRSTPDAWEQTLPEVFPETAPGNFTFSSDMNLWVWTTFNQYQWDLNYANPHVFLEMLTNATELTNMGADILRFDALAFLWKKRGTNCQNLPETHTLIQLFKMCLQVVAPGSIILAEAIVAPQEIVKYFGGNKMQGNQCDLAYNASLMVLLWESLATKKAILLRKSINNLPHKPFGTSWINYARCHDDIGLGFEDDLIYELGWNAKMHREFILNYYTGNYPGSAARGKYFMYNPASGDARLTGSMASLAGLEVALESKDERKIGQSIAKIRLLHAVLLSYGGIPMIYYGDEQGTLNWYEYINDADKKGDSRWLNRPLIDWTVIEGSAKKPWVVAIHGDLKKLLQVRKAHAVFNDTNNFELIEIANPHIFSFMRFSDAERVLVIVNFNDQTERISFEAFKKANMDPFSATELINEYKIPVNQTHLQLKGFGVSWWFINS